MADAEASVVGGGPAGGMAAAEILRLDDHHPHIAGQPGAEAGTRDPATNNQDVNARHFPAGYGLERRAV